MAEPLDRDWLANEIRDVDIDIMAGSEPGHPFAHGVTADPATLSDADRHRLFMRLEARFKAWAGESFVAFLGRTGGDGPDARAEGPTAASPLGGPPSGLEAGRCPPVSRKGSIFDRPDGPLAPFEVQALAFLRDEPHTLDLTDEGGSAALIVFRGLERIGLVAMDVDDGEMIVSLLAAGRTVLAEAEGGEDG